MSKAPVIDGQFSDAEWQDALLISGLVGKDGLLSSRKAQFRIGIKDGILYGAMASELPPNGDILASFVSTARNDSNALYQDDIGEFWFSPMTNETRTEHTAYRLATNAVGSLYTSKHNPTANQGFAAWDCHPTIKNARADGVWITEFSLSLSDLGVSMADLIGVNFRAARNWRQPTECDSTEAWGDSSFANAATMSRLILDPEAPVIQNPSLGDWIHRDLHWEFSLRNTSERAQRFQVNLNIASTSSMPPKVFDQVIELAPGEVKRATLESPLFADVICNAQMNIASTDNAKTIFHRDFQLDTPQRNELWQMKEDIHTQEPTLYIAFSPYRNQLGLKIFNLTPSEKIASLSCEVKDAQSNQVVLTKNISAPVKSTDETSIYGLLDLPSMADGRYQATSTITYIDGRKQAFTQDFNRTSYPWEHTDLGQDHFVPSSFAALSVKEHHLQAILRDYVLSPTGFPDQILAEGTPLLSKPTSIRATSGRTILHPENAALTITSAADDQVRGASSWDLGSRKGRVEFQMDYDGFLRFTMGVSKGREPIDGVEISIPLRNREISYFHSVGAGIRGNYAGRIATGEGTIWTNLQAVSYGYPHGFIPYLWMGGTRRGLAWTADSSAGWEIGTGQPSATLSREGDNLTLKLRLVSREIPPDQEVKVTFALQATPVKDRPKNWRLFDFVEQFPGVTTIKILGSCPYWGGISAFGDFYPRNHDYRILEQEYEATQTKTVTPEMKSFIAKWNLGNADLTNAAGINDHVERGFQKAAQSDFVIPYTDAREIRQSTPEFRLFQDEWVRKGFNPRAWSDGNTECISTEAVPSFQDFALWHFKKMKDVGFAKGIYFDNDFPTAGMNPFLEYASIRDRSDPGALPTGIYDVRDYLKRAYTMFANEDALPLNTVHMTNSALAPHLAFATISLDWEMKYGASDFQDRFSEDYIFASTMGEQFGTIPLVLSGIFPSKEKSLTWLTRSLIGTTFIYELKIYASSQIDQALYKSVFDIIYGFGYGRSDCKVYRYWENPPYRLSRDDARAILLERNGRILFMLTDFGNGGELSVQIDSASLNNEKAWSARDVETNALIPIDKNSFKLQLDKHQFKLVELTEKKGT